MYVYHLNMREEEQNKYKNHEEVETGSEHPLLESSLYTSKTDMTCTSPHLLIWSDGEDNIISKKGLCLNWHIIVID